MRERGELPRYNWAVAGFVAAAGRETGAEESERPSEERGGGGVPAERGAVGPVCDASERCCDWLTIIWAAKRCSGRRDGGRVKSLPSPAGNNTCLDRSACRAGMQADAALIRCSLVMAPVAESSLPFGRGSVVSVCTTHG